MSGNGGHYQSITIWRSLRDAIRANLTTSAGPIIDNDLLA